MDERSIAEKTNFCTMFRGKKWQKPKIFEKRGYKLFTKR